MDLARSRMIEHDLRGRGIRDERVLQAFDQLDRRLFVDGPLQTNAYQDGALPIGCGQTISQPFIVARMTELLELDGTEQVLEIGTGSGYQAALLALLCKRVFTIERHRELTARARGLFQELELRNVLCRSGDGTLGWPEEAPFDRIIITAAAPQPPEILLRQLKIGGWLVAPIGDRGRQELKVIVRHSEDRYSGHSEGGCSFVPLIGKDGWDS